MQVIYTNNYGELCQEPLLAEFTDERGDQWIVTIEWRSRAPICLPRGKVEFYIPDKISDDLNHVRSLGTMEA